MRPQKSAAKVAKAKIGERLAFVDRHLTGRPCLLGATFTVANAYMFTIADWCRLVGIDLAPYPRLAAYMDRIAARPAVRETWRAAGLLRDAA